MVLQIPAEPKVNFYYASFRRQAENNKYNQFCVSSKADIQKVINFFFIFSQLAGAHPLIGLKRIQYLKWLNNLQISSRYNNLNFPPQ